MSFRASVPLLTLSSWKSVAGASSTASAARRRGLEAPVARPGPGPTKLVHQATSARTNRARPAPEKPVGVENPSKSKRFRAKIDVLGPFRGVDAKVFPWHKPPWSLRTMLQRFRCRKSSAVRLEVHADPISRAVKGGPQAPGRPCSASNSLPVAPNWPVSQAQSWPRA